MRNFAAPPPSQSWDLDGLFLWEMNFTVIIIQETLKFKLSKYPCCAVRVCCLTKRGSVPKHFDSDKNVGPTFVILIRILYRVYYNIEN